MNLEMAASGLYSITHGSLVLEENRRLLELKHLRALGALSLAPPGIKVRKRFVTCFLSQAA